MHCCSFQGLEFPPADTGTGMGWERNPTSPTPPLTAHCTRGGHQPQAIVKCSSPALSVHRAAVLGAVQPGDCSSPNRSQGGSQGPIQATRHSLQCKFTENANDPFHFILLTDCAGSNNGLLLAPVITAWQLLTLCKRPATIGV